METLKIVLKGIKSLFILKIDPNRLMTPGEMYLKRYESKTAQTIREN